MKRTLLIFAVLAAPAMASGILQWNLVGRTSKCIDFDDMGTPCVAPALQPFELVWDAPYDITITGDGFSVVRMTDWATPFSISFSPTSIVGMAGDLGSSIEFYLQLLVTPPSDYNFSGLPVIAYLTLSAGNQSLEYDGMTGTLSSSVSDVLHEHSAIEAGTSSFRPPPNGNVPEPRAFLPLAGIGLIFIGRYARRQKH